MNNNYIHVIMTKFITDIKQGKKGVIRKKKPNKIRKDIRTCDDGH